MPSNSQCAHASMSIVFLHNCFFELGIQATQGIWGITILKLQTGPTVTDVKEAVKDVKEAVKN